MSRRVVLGASALLAAATIVLGVMRAFSAAWLSDDSFISFRYAQQLVHGNGLVYNAGERVEAYTNLLWTLLLAAAMRIGIRPEISAHVLGLGFWLALIGLLALASYRRALSFAPLAAALVLLMEACSPSSPWQGCCSRARLLNGRLACCSPASCSSRRWAPVRTGSSSRRWPSRESGLSTKTPPSEHAWPSPRR
jgi:hypothetical protein